MQILFSLQVLYLEGTLILSSVIIDKDHTFAGKERLEPIK